MADFIDRKALIKKLKNDPLFPLVEQYGITGVIESFPAANVKPAPSGHWIELDSCMEICSECGGLGCGSKFCPNCGCAMEVQDADS